MIGQLSQQIERHWEELGLQAPPRPSEQRWLVMNGGIGAESKLVCLLWTSCGSHPDFVVKFARYPIYNSKVEAEYHALHTVQHFAPAGLGPAPLLAFQLGDLLVTVETAVPGRLLRFYLREHPQRHARTLRGFQSLLRWLILVHTNSARPATDDDLRHLILEPLESAVEEHGDFSAREIESIERLYARAKEIVPGPGLPIVFNHNDLTATNVLVDGHGELSGVIDWEFAGHGLPLLDLFYFLGSYGYEARGIPSGKSLHGFRELFYLPAGNARGSLPVSLTERWLCAYCRSLGIDPTWLPLLFALTWLLHARHERIRAIGLRCEGSGHSGSSSRSAPDQLHFRSHLRYFLENFDGSLVAALAGGFGP